MRLAASITGVCPKQSKPTGKFHTFRYSLRLEFKAKGSFNFTPFAYDLTPSDNPMKLPVTALPFGNIESTDGTLRVIEQRQK